MFQRAYYPESGVLATPKTRRFALQGLNSPAVSPSIFVFGRISSMLSDKLLAKEFGLQVWAVDPWIKPTENWERIRKAGLEQQVFPLNGDALRLPFPQEFFDAVIAINSMWFFASEDLYLGRYLIPLVKPGGQFGVVLPGFYHEFGGDLPGDLPNHLKPYWDSCALCAWHSADWWRRHWARTSQVEVLLADNFPENEGYQTYLRWEQIIEYEEKLAADNAGRAVTFVRLVARRKQPQLDKEL